MDGQSFTVVILLGIGALVLYPTIVAAGKLNIAYTFPKSPRITQGAAVWTQPIFITNPTIETIDVRAINMKLIFNGNVVGNFFSVLPLKLVAGNTVKKELECRIILGAFAQTLLNLGGRVNLVLAGEVNCYGFNVPLPSQSFTFNFIK
jgi:hypothetical protein